MLEELRLENFKAFREQSIPLRPLTLLSGLNGMGKSSALQSLLLLRQSFQQRLLPEVGLALNGDYVELGRGQDVLFENATNDDIHIGLRSESVEADWHFTYYSAADTLNLAAPVPPQIYESNLFTKYFHYLNAERMGPRALLPSSDYQVRDQRQLGIHGEYVAYFLQMFGNERVDRDILYHPLLTKQAIPPLASLVADWLSEISPGARFDITAIDGVEMVRLTFEFDRGGVPTKQFRATNVGFGISYILPILVALLSSVRGQFVIVENPEAHLHPRGQVKMGELIARAASAGVQVIVETHSDHVLNGIRLAAKTGIIAPENVALHFFQRPEDDDGTAGVEVVTPELDSDGRIDFWPEGFFDEYGRALRNLL